jgi:hypothetical protein
MLQRFYLHLGKRHYIASRRLALVVCLLTSVAVTQGWANDNSCNEMHKRVERQLALIELNKQTFSSLLNRPIEGETLSPTEKRELLFTSMSLEDEYDKELERLSRIYHNLGCNK